MSNNIYYLLNDKYNKYLIDNIYNLNISIINAKCYTYELLLIFIKNMTNDDAYFFLDKHIIKFKSKKSYYNNLKNNNFNLFQNVDDIINKIDTIDDENFYTELNNYLLLLQNLIENKSINEKIKKKNIKKNKCYCIIS